MATNNGNSSLDPKTIGILAYLTPIGWLIAYVLNSSNRSDYASFHIRQMLGLIIAGMAFRLIPKFLFMGAAVTAIGSVAVFAFWVIAFIGAVQGDERRIPIIGDSIQQWFKSV